MQQRDPQIVHVLALFSTFGPMLRRHSIADAWSSLEDGREITPSCGLTNLELYPFDFETALVVSCNISESPSILGMVLVWSL